MAGFPIAVVGASLTDVPGLVGRVVAPQGKILPNPGIIGGPVLAMGKQVATVTSPITPHGNFTNPKAPGYNPICGKATIVSTPTVNVLVNGKPVAVAGTGAGAVCSCTHTILTGIPNIMVGIM